MGINVFARLQKSLLHLHTQVNLDVTDIFYIAGIYDFFLINLPFHIGKNYTLVDAQIHGEYKDQPCLCIQI